MKQEKKRKKVERKLRVVRIAVYTAISFTIFQYIGIFALANLKGIYVTTNSRLNAFYPKTYVNVDLKENDNENHVYVLDEDGNAFVSGDLTQSKELYVKNPGTNKKDVVVRAKIVANIYREDGTVMGEVQNYKITGQALTNDLTNVAKWYNKDVKDATDKKEFDSKSGGDEYFYYTSVLEKNQDTTKLFENVQLTDMSDIPEDGWVEFNIIVDSVEVDWDADDPYEKAKKAWGETVINSLTALKKKA